MVDSSVAALTALASRTGDELLYVVDDPAGTPADRKATINQIIGGPFALPFWADANTHLFTHTSGAATQALTANRLYQVPIRVYYPRTFTIIAISLNAESGSTGCRVGIYNTKKDEFQPTTLVVDGGIISTATSSGTGLRTASISQALEPGVYSLALVSDGAPTLVAGSSPPLVNIGATVISSGQRPTFGIIRNFTYGALPADETAQAYTVLNAGAVTGAPLLGLR